MSRGIIEAANKGAAVNKASGNEATAYCNKDHSYVVARSYVMARSPSNADQRRRRRRVKWSVTVIPVAGDRGQAVPVVVAIREALAGAGFSESVAAGVVSVASESGAVFGHARDPVGDGIIG